MRKKTKLLCGVGVNDAQFPTEFLVNGKKAVVPSYRCWASMLDRCYGKTVKARRKTYVGCYVCTEWLSYSAFHEWYEGQYKEPGYHLDKDIICPGNKLYSPKTCALVSRKVNSFVTSGGSSLSKYMIGCGRCEKKGKYQSNCSNPFTGKVEYIGMFDFEIDAHLAWKSRKHELACQLAETVSDYRVAKALRERYA